MQTRSQQGPLLYQPDLERTIVRPNRRRIDQDLERNLALEIEEIVIMAAENRLTLADYAMPGAVKVNPAIVLPAINAPTFELKPGLIQMMQHASIFYGLQSENPHTHIHTFLEICGTTRIQGVSEDAIKLKLFPFSLKGEAKEWYNSLPAESITTWAELEKEFLSQYFPPSKTAQCLSDIFTFYQKENESFFDCWKRFKALLRKCPHHGLDLQRQVNTFFSGLTELTKGMVNSSSGGAFLKKTPTEGWALFEDIAKYNYAPTCSGASGQKSSGKYEVDETTSLKAQLAALQKQVAAMNVPSLVCDNCHGQGHRSNQCQLDPTSQVKAVQNNVVCQNCDTVGHTFHQCHLLLHTEEVNAFNSQNYRPSGQNQNTQGFNYNRNHPGFRWSDPSGAANPHHFQAPRPNQNNFQSNSRPAWNTNPPVNQNQNQNQSFQILEQKLSEQALANTQLANALSTLTSTVRNLEVQLGQISGQQASRPQGQLPSFTEKNPRGVNLVQNDQNTCTDLAPPWSYGQDELNAINLRSGKAVGSQANQGNE